MSNSILDDCKKYLGLPPYNDFTNIVAHDSYFLNSIYSKYGKQSVDSLLYMLRGQVWEVK